MIRLSDSATLVGEEIRTVVLTLQAAVAKQPDNAVDQIRWRRQSKLLNRLRAAITG